MRKNFKIALIILSIAAFVISLTQDCYTIDGKQTIGSFGLTALLMGLLNMSKSFVVWFANPLYILSTIFVISSKKASKPLATLALGLSLSFLFIDEIVINEGGTKGKVDGYLLGYWLWVSSICLIMLAAYINQATSANRRSQPLLVRGKLGGHFPKPQKP